MTMTLEALSVIDAIARRGSFAAAAAELGKVPSAITYTVRRLEDDLDVLLFDRRGRRAMLTAAGQELLEQGRGLLRAAEDLESRVREVAAGWEVELRIAADALVCFDRLRPMIEDFYRQASPTRLRLTQEVLDGGWDALLDGRADLALGVGLDAPAEVLAGGRFLTRPLGEVDFVFCVAPHHPLAHAAEPVAAEALREHRAVAIANTARSLPPRSSGLLSGQDLLTVASFEQKVDAQISGLGCGHLPEPFARPHLASGRLVARRLAQPRAPAALRYAWRASARGKALKWWLDRLAIPRVRAKLLAGPLTALDADPPEPRGTDGTQDRARRGRERD